MPARSPLARGPVAAAMAALAVVLTITSNGYGFHRDELYFRMLRPAWGYVDQPPFTPWLARTFALISDDPWALRIPATIAAVTSVLVVASITRELGGARAAQALCAWAYAFATLPLVMGHTLLTASVDLIVWPAVTLFVMRALLRAQPRWWLAAGALVGLSTFNKLLIGLLVVALLCGLAIAGPRRVLRSPWLLAGAGLALALSVPNLVYQATHSWPQLTMGAALSDNNAGEVRVLIWPFLLVLLGPPLAPIWIAGVVGLLRRRAWRPVRALAPAFAALVLISAAAGGQIYYPFGLLAVMFAAGCVPTAELMARSARLWRPLVVAAVGLNAAVSMVVALPLLPVKVLGRTPVPDMNQAARDTVGWPAYVGQVARVVTTLPPDDGPAVVVTSNYGEAGAIRRYGPAAGIPAVYSGLNELYFQARPPDDTRTVVVVGWQLDDVRALFGQCTMAGTLDNGVGVDNEEQGAPIAVCRAPRQPWPRLWPRFQHYG